MNNLILISGPHLWPLRIEGVAGFAQIASSKREVAPSIELVTLVMGITP